MFAAAATAAAGLSVGGLAIAGVIGSAPLHEAKLDVPATTLASGLSTCHLINRSAADVAAKLTSAGIAVEWRYTRWGTTVASPPTGSSPGVVTGGSSDPVSSVPGDSVVWNVSPDGSSKAIVSVEAANDPRAPTVSVEGCSS